MGRFVARRLVVAVLLLVASSAALTLLIEAAPGDVAQLLAERRMPGASQADVQRIGQELGLYDPLPVRWARWVGAAVQGDLGTSLRTGNPVTVDLAARAGRTLQLCGVAALLAAMISFGLAILGARWPGSALDRAIRGTALTMVSFPSFYVGALLILAFSLRLGWLPTIDDGSLRSLVLPAVTLSLLPAGVLSRVIRVSLEEVASQPFITAARARGARPSSLLVRESLPNIAVPCLNAVGTQVGLLMIGAVVIEQLFSRQGAALYYLEAVRFRDLPALLATLLTFAAVFIIINALVDVLAHLVDPRYRRATAGGLS